MDKKKKKIAITTKKLKKTKKGWLEILFSSDRFIVFFFFIAALIVYSNSFNVPFQFDDHNQISYRRWYHTFDFFKNLSNWFHVQDRPVSFFTFTINYVLHGEKVGGYHLVNFLIHLFTGVALYFWLKMLPVIKNEENKFRWFPIVVTLFFLLHPVQTQSVTYIIQRMTSLSGMFLIFSVLLYTIGRIRHLEKNNLWIGLPFYCLSIIAGILGVFSKQNTIVFPVVLLLVELFFIRNKEGKICRKYLIAATMAFVLLLGLALYKIGLPSETQAFSRLQYLATQMKVIPRYFQMMLFPVGLSIDHGVKVVDSFLNVWTVMGTLFLSSIIVFALMMVKKEPLFSFGIFWVFVTLSVESSIIPITDPMFDQRMYLPLAGFGIAAWALANRYFFQRKRHLIKPVAISILLLFSILTFARNNVWQSRVAIWTDVTNKYPDHLRGWMALGKMYEEGEEKNVLKSIECFEKVRKIDPNNEENLLDLGYSYLENRQEEKAISCYTGLLGSKDKSKRQQAHKVLSAYYASRGNSESAAKYLRETIADNSSDIEAWKKLCSIYLDKKDFRKANDISLEWLSKNPEDSNANFFVGKSYFYLNERETARKYLLKTIKLDTINADAMMLYANTCVNSFDYDEAILYLEKAYAINRNSKIPENIALVRQLKIQTPKPQ